jgi:hypothetical protein
MTHKIDEEAADRAWAWLREVVTTNRTLSADAFMVLVVVVMLEITKGELSPDPARLVKMTSLSAGRCAAAHKELKAAGLLSEDGRGAWE